MLGDALKEFELALDDISSIFDFVRASIRLRPRLNSMLSWNSMGIEERSLVRGFLNQRNADESLLYRGMVISLAGSFEHFGRRILRDSVLAMSGGKFDSIDAQIRRENFYRTGLALGTIHEPLDYLELNYESLARNLGTCFSGSPQALLNAEAFALFHSVTSPNSVQDALRRIGVSLNWDVFGRDEELQGILGTKGTRETTKAVTEALGQFCKTRNRVAHTGSTGPVITEAEFERFLRFFREFSRVLAKAVEAALPKGT